MIERTSAAASRIVANPRSEAAPNLILDIAHGANQPRRPPRGHTANGTISDDGDTLQLVLQHQRRHRVTGFVQGHVAEVCLAATIRRGDLTQEVIEDERTVRISGNAARGPYPAFHLGGRGVSRKVLL